MISNTFQLAVMVGTLALNNTAQKMKFFINDFFSKCDQIRWKLKKKSLTENFIFCAVQFLANVKIL